MTWWPFRRSREPPPNPAWWPIAAEVEQMMTAGWSKDAIILRIRQLEDEAAARHRKALAAADAAVTALRRRRDRDKKAKAEKRKRLRAAKKSQRNAASRASADHPQTFGRPSADRPSLAARFCANSPSTSRARGRLIGGNSMAESEKWTTHASHADRPPGRDSLFTRGANARIE